MYYLRTQPAAAAIQFTVDKSKLGTPLSAPGKENSSPLKERKNLVIEPEVVGPVCRMEEGCLMCGS
jgi:hypothetical protein